MLSAINGVMNEWMNEWVNLIELERHFIAHSIRQGTATNGSLTYRFKMAYLHNCTCQMEEFGNITRATTLSQCHYFISHLTGMLGVWQSRLAWCPCLLRYIEACCMFLLTWIHHGTVHVTPLPQPLNGMCCAHGVFLKGWQTINALYGVAQNVTPPRPDQHMNVILLSEECRLVPNFLQ